MSAIEEKTYKELVEIRKELQKMNLRKSNKAKIIKRLILDNLINSKLVRALNRVGLDAFNYHVEIPETILSLMEIKMSDDDFGSYLKMYHKVDEINISEEEKLKVLVDEIYNHLTENK